MPIHDWTRVRAGTFHHFHQTWTPIIAAELNGGRLPPGYFAMVEQRARGPEPDVVTLKLPPTNGEPGGIAIEACPPKVRFHTETDAANYTRRSNRITIRHDDGDLVSVIEILSPGNKDSRHAIRAFTRKAVEFLQAGIHLLIVDLFPPNPRNPQGIHKAIWDRLRDEPFELPQDKPLTLAAYSVGTKTAGYIEPVAVGDSMPDMPIFLTADRYVPCPLEATYQMAWNVFPAALKGPLG